MIDRMTKDGWWIVWKTNDRSREPIQSDKLEDRYIEWRKMDEI